MDWSVFWEAAGAIATFLAVCVALWQTKYTNKKRLKITFVEKMCYMPTVPIGSMGYMPKTEYAGLDISNTGNRKIIVQSFGLELANGSKAVIAPETTPLGTQKWPIELDIEESAFLPWNRKLFISFINNEDGIMLDSKLKFYVVDSTGVTYHCETDKTKNQYLTNAKKDKIEFK